MAGVYDRYTTFDNMVTHDTFFLSDFCMDIILRYHYIYQIFKSSAFAGVNIEQL
jgi:hypothetical protein